MDGLQYGYQVSRRYIKKSDGDGCLKGLALCVMMNLVLLMVAAYGLIVAHYVFGIYYFHDCEAQPLLPIFLIVNASIHIVESFFRTDENSSSYYCIKSIKAIFIVAWIVWLALGTTWVIEVRDVIYSPGHCEATTPSTITISTTSVAPTTSTAAVVNSKALTRTNTDSILLSALTPKTTSASKCATCNEVLTNVTFVFVFVEWGFAAVLIPSFVMSICCFVYRRQFTEVP